MLRIDFVTLFPDMIREALAHSMMQRAVSAGVVEFAQSNPRDFATDRHRTVDDKPFGGGPGMLMKPEPIDAALRQLLGPPPNAGSPHPRTPGFSLEEGEPAVVLPDPTGPIFDQRAAVQLAMLGRVVFLCGHYEGIDERVCQVWVTHRYSIGDYVLTGGELPALVMADAIVRLLPGVLGEPGSLEIDSHADGLLSAPQYTRPEVWNGVPVPEVLKTGDHGAIAKWKRQVSLELTRRNRPDLFAKARLAKSDLALLQFGTAEARDAVVRNTDE